METKLRKVLKAQKITIAKAAEGLGMARETTEKKDAS